VICAQVSPAGHRVPLTTEPLFNPRVKGGQKGPPFRFTKEGHLVPCAGEGKEFGNSCTETPADPEVLLREGQVADDQVVSVQCHAHTAAVERENGKVAISGNDRGLNVA
jgi:hypothetical protein